MWLHEGATILRYVYIAFSVVICANKQHIRPGTGRYTCWEFENFFGLTLRICEFKAKMRQRQWVESSKVHEAS
jgi:hypothetical protein